MEIDHPADEAGDKIRAENPHEACQNNKLSITSRKSISKRVLKIGAFRECAVIDDRRFDTRASRVIESFGFRIVADDQRDLIVPAVAQQGLQVRTSTRDQNREGQPGGGGVAGSAGWRGPPVRHCSGPV